MRATHPPGPKIGREASIRRRPSDRKATGHSKWRGRWRQPTRIARQRRSLLHAVAHRIVGVADRRKRSGNGDGKNRGEELAENCGHYVRSLARNL